MAGSQRETSTQTVAETLEFDKLATTLGMPEVERRSILGLTESAYHAWRSGTVDLAAPIAPEFLRRLGYALPLMRRMAANLPMVPVSRIYDRPQPTVN